MAIAPQRLGIGHPPLLHHRRPAPLRRGHLGASRRAHHELPGRLGRLRAARRRGARRPGRSTRRTSSPRSTSAARSARASARRASSRWSTASSTRSRVGRSKRDYFVDDEEAETFRAELKHLIVTQKAAFNSPVWFNIGVQGRAPAGERVLHPRGQRLDGARSSTGTPRRASSSRAARAPGVNLSQDPLERRAARGRRHRAAARCRSCAAPTRRPARSSRAARRGARRRWSSSTSTTPTSRSSSGARRTRSARRACCATPASTWTSTARTSTRSSTRTPTTRCASRTSSCTRCSRTRDWDLTARGDGRVIAHGQGARALARDRPGRVGVRRPRPAVRHDDQPAGTPSSNTARINGSNPCSEYMHIDNSACNLASLNLHEVPARGRPLRRRRPSRRPSRSSSPPRRSSWARPTTRPRRSARTRASSASSASATPTSARCSWPRAWPTTPTAGRAWAAAITALMTGHAYATSARTAGRMGPHAGFDENAEPMLNVLRMHRDAAARDRRRPGARPSCSRRPRPPGTTPSSSARATACATPRRRCSRRPARSGC